MEVKNYARHVSIKVVKSRYKVRKDLKYEDICSAKDYLISTIIFVQLMKETFTKTVLYYFRIISIYENISEMVDVFVFFTSTSSTLKFIHLVHLDFIPPVHLD